MPVAMITGASKGLGRALAAALAQRGWDLVLDARIAGVLEGTAKELAGYGRRVVAVPGDVTDAGHRGELVAAAGELGGLDLHEASHLLMLEAVAGRAALQCGYAEALRHRYLWHEFGDVHLLLPDPEHDTPNC